MTDGTFTLVDARGRKYLTAPERDRFLAAARSHPKPAVQTLARTLAMTGCRVSEALGIRASRRRPRGGGAPDFDAQAPRGALAGRSGPRGPGARPWSSYIASDASRRARGAANRPLWPITRQTANRQVGAIMRSGRHRGPAGVPAGPSPQLRRRRGHRRASRSRPSPRVLGHASLTTTAIYTTALGAEARELVSRVWA